MRIQSVRLEHHRHAALRRRHVIHNRAFYLKRTAGYPFKPRNHSEQRGLAAPGRTDKHNKFALVNFEIYVAKNFDFTVRFADIFKADFGHSCFLSLCCD